MSSEEGEPLHFDLERGCSVGRRYPQSGALQLAQRWGIARLEAQLEKPTAVRGLHGVQHTEDRLVVFRSGFHMNTWGDVGPWHGTPESEASKNPRSVRAGCEALNLKDELLARVGDAAETRREIVE